MTDHPYPPLGSRVRIDLDHPDHSDIVTYRFGEYEDLVGYVREIRPNDSLTEDGATVIQSGGTLYAVPPAACDHIGPVISHD